MFYTLEICAATYRSAVAATRAGASRIELCAELGTGGVTPSYGMIEQVRADCDIAVNVLIRPRSGDFLYTSDEVEIVLRDIALCARAKVQGIVVGALTPDARIDRTVAHDWLKEAHSRGLSATFHRAVDRTADILGATDDIASLGYDRILSSGGHPTAYEGMETLRDMVRLVHGKTVIMPGSGINPSNIREIAQFTGTHELHFSASRKYRSEMKVSGGIASPESFFHSDPDLIAAAREALVR